MKLIMGGCKAVGWCHKAWAKLYCDPSKFEGVCSLHSNRLIISWSVKNVSGVHYTLCLSCLVLVNQGQKVDKRGVGGKMVAPSLKNTHSKYESFA